MNRELVAERVFARLSGIEGIRTSSRRPVAWDQVEPGARPAVFMGVGNSENVGNPGGAALWRLEFVAYLYVYDGSSAGPSSILNDLLEKLEEAFRPDSQDAAPGITVNDTTLGGLVLYARPTQVQTDEGSFGDHGVAVVTIEVLTAG